MLKRIGFFIAAALFLMSCAPSAPSQPAPQASPAAEQPRYGGELVFAVDAEPPSLDAHRETTFAVLHPLAPFYSTLLEYHPDPFHKPGPCRRLAGGLTDPLRIDDAGAPWYYQPTTE
jgi:ABC-type transport system substrate-binding protein